MNLLYVVILLTIPTSFAFVKKPNATMKPHAIGHKFKKGPVYVHTTISPEERKRNHGLFPQTVTKYVVTTPPQIVKTKSEDSRMNLKPKLKTKTLPRAQKYNHLKTDQTEKPMSMGLFRKKAKVLNEQLLRDKIPQISIGISSEEVNTETNENIAEDFNQELLNDLQVTENFDVESDPYEATLRIKSTKHHPTKNFYEDSVRSKHPTKWATKDIAKKDTAKKGEIYNFRKEIKAKEPIVNVAMEKQPEETTVVPVTKAEPEVPVKFEYLRPKRNSKYFAQDIEELNKDLEELIFLRTFENDINVDDVKSKDETLMEFTKWFRKA